MEWNDGDKVRIGVNAQLLGFVVLTCKLLFFVVLLLSQPLNFLVMYVVFLHGPWNI
jgi:hypothetical protein